MAEVRDLARKHTEDAITTLAEIMLDKNEPARARAAAADILLDRGWGKAPASLDLGGTGGVLQVTFIRPDALASPVVEVAPSALLNEGDPSGDGGDGA